MIHFKNDIFETALGLVLVVNAVISGFVVVYTLISTLFGG